MSDLPARPPAPAPPLPSGWTEHKAPSGHTYFYNKETKKSTYTRPTAEAHQFSHPHPPAASSSLGATSVYNQQQPARDGFNPQRQMQDLIFASAPKQFVQPDRAHHNSRGGHRGGFHRGQNNFNDRRRQHDDRPKHRHDIPNCAPWVLVKTKFGRRFVWNKDTNESFWKFPPNVMKAVVEFDQKERERRERRERGEPSDVEEEDAAMAEIEAELAEAEEEVEIVEVDGEQGMENDEEYEEVEVTDGEGEEGSAPKRQRTEEPAGGQPPEDDDLAWQLAQMEEMEAMEQEGGHDEEYYEDEEPALTEDDCKALFKELLDDTRISPFTPWDKILEAGALYDDERYKALPNMVARKDCFNEWAREKSQYLKAEKARQQKRDPRIPYLAFLSTHATPKLYWPEFRRKFKKEAEMKDTKLSDKDKETLYRDHIKRLGMRSSELKSDLSALLRAQPLALLNRSSTLDTLPSPILTDLRYISVPQSTRDSLIETYISTLPPAPEGMVYSAEEEAERAKKWAERERREKALADREQRVREAKRKQERDLAYGKGRLREEEEEIERAMKVGKEGLKGHLKE
ncbi:uncharacterized protein K460DRAFT_381946 [Cucurbitaria berberidis CBS 394.84]|uniref:WW domain-containing protein n=1 Tax=Cucurbitaria berberidis CBS 394.84 TaxID=1168544 RepID=A0A9P4LCL4_9PLEO|nr:uncharacterized protein K460DRAFT_381946 [Cucurbitaria berberidis CBS 394.84]KAF1850115.1 hypothetical protein K460DRAFT_381946 [Cucurbitaria berberidis CBS 394.84]